MPALKDITGIRFGKLVAIRQHGKGQKGGARWECVCDCGRSGLYRSDKLNSGETKSCGCLKRSRQATEDIKGARFGRLTAVQMLRTVPNASGRTAIWLCDCACGNQVEVRRYSLTTGNTRSCGCLEKELATERATTHGGSKLNAYQSYIAMRRRCLLKTDPAYKWYGGRGIKICDRWLDSFENFLADMGERDRGLSIERIDNDGDYCPENCKWVTMEEQRRTQRNPYQLFPKNKNPSHWPGLGD